MTNLPFDSLSKKQVFTLKEPISCLTHLAGCLSALIAFPFLLLHAAHCGAPPASMVSLAVFMTSMVFLYGASASYHAIDSTPVVNRILKKADHLSIFLLIAGSYTPVCICVLPPSSGLPLLFAVWGIALLGMGFKFFRINCPKYVSSIIYIGMGWVCLAVLPQLIHLLNPKAFFWLAAGGMFYTIGGIIYAVKKQITPPNSIGFGNHELFHLYILAGSLCHFIFMYLYVL